MSARTPNAAFDRWMDEVCVGRWRGFSQQFQTAMREAWEAGSKHASEINATDVDAAAVAWADRIGALPVLTPNPDEAFKAGAAWAMRFAMPANPTLAMLGLIAGEDQDPPRMSRDQARTIYNAVRALVRHQPKTGDKQ